MNFTECIIAVQFLMTDAIFRVKTTTNNIVFVLSDYKTQENALSETLSVFTYVHGEVTGHL